MVLLDHSILLSRLSYSFGISDTVLAWFTSYLTDRTQTISVNGSKSLPAPLHYGVPQGSVLGPILFVLYTQPFSTIIQQHSLYHPRSGELRTQKLKSHLVRTQSLNVLPFKPGVGQYIAIHATLTTREFFLAYFSPSSPFTCIFSKTSFNFFLCWPAE